MSIYGNPEDKYKKKDKSKSKREISDDLLSRKAEPEIQELDARVLPLAGLIPIAGAAGVAALIGKGASATMKKSKREMLDDLFSREAQDWVESVRNQASKREPSPVRQGHKERNPAYPTVSATPV